MFADLDYTSSPLLLNASPSRLDAAQWLTNILALDREDPVQQEQIFNMTFVDMLHKALLVLLPTDDDAVRDARKLLNKAVFVTGSLPSALIFHTGSIVRPNLSRPWVPSFPGAFCGKVGGRMVTVKPLRLPQGSEAWERGKHKQVFYEECLLLSQLDHPFLVPFLGVAAFAKPGVLPGFAVFPWYDKGSIRSFMDTNNVDLGQVLQWTIEFTDALVFLHDRQVPLVHGDLRADNIIVTADGHVQLSGFAFSWRSPAITWQDPMSLYHLLGYQTLRWKTPDHLTEDFYQGKLPAGDMWSWGCTVYEVFTGEDPYNYLGNGPRPWENRSRWHRNEGPLLLGMMAGKLPAITRPQEPEARKTMPPELWELVNRCWAKDPGDRPSAAEALSQLKEIYLKEKTE